MTTQSRIRILTVVDHPLSREGIATVIRSLPDMLLTAEAASAHEALQRFREHRPDVTLMDLRLADSSGIEAIIAIRTHFPDARVILLSNFDEDVQIESTVQAGAWGCILKTMRPQEMAEVIRQVHGGKKSISYQIAAHPAGDHRDDALTPREVEVLAHVAGGNRNRDIGQRLRISEDTVKRHMQQIMQKLGARDLTNALTIAARRGIIRL